MVEQNIDCIVALDLSRDDVLLGTQRWLPALSAAIDLELKKGAVA